MVILYLCCVVYVQTGLREVQPSNPRLGSLCLSNTRAYTTRWQWPNPPSIWNLRFDNMYIIVFTLAKNFYLILTKAVWLFMFRSYTVNLGSKVPLAFPVGAFPTQKNQRPGYAHLGCLLMIQDHSELSLHKLWNQLSLKLQWQMIWYCKLSPLESSCNYCTACQPKSVLTGRCTKKSKEEIVNL